MIFGFILLFFYFGVFISFTELQDGFRHRQYVADKYFGMTFVQFILNFFKIFTLDAPAGYKEDLYLHVLSYISAVLGSEKLVHVFASIVMGFFVGKTFVNFLTHLSGKHLSRIGDLKHTLSSLVIIAVIFLHYSLAGVNSIRAWSGMWYVFWISSELYLNRNRKFVWFYLGAPIFHFMYIPFAFLALVHHFFAFKYEKTLIFLFLASFALPMFNIDTVSLVPGMELFQEKKEVYSKSGEEAIDFQSKVSIKNILFSGSSFYADGILVATNYVLPLIAFIVLGFRKNLTPLVYKLFLLGISLYFISNLFAFSIPSIAGRYRSVSLFFIVSPLVSLIYLGGLATGTKRLISRVVAFLFIPYLLFSLSIIFGYMSPYTLVTPFIGALDNDYLSLKEILTF